MKGLFKKILQGLMFGLGFGIAFVFVQMLAVSYFFDEAVGRSFTSTDFASDEINTPPPIVEGYLGSTGVSSGNISDIDNNVLAAGAGEIRGVVVGDGKRVEGLRLRLGLNSAVYSQWATTDAAGEYRIAVPFGEYQVNGFQLDSDTTDGALPGLIISPMNQHRSDRFLVAEGEPGEGLDLQFVKPVVKRVKTKLVTLDEPIVLAWEPYPEASYYRVQVQQKANLNDYLGNDTLFAWADMPEVTDASLVLQDFTENLTSGYFYTYYVTAISEGGARISESQRRHQGYDFQIQ
ncbi:hypothetical protein [Gilvimarinus polysaccharolyticus]|uniref:hypothetical protein n=1 Tax=Gilvimarinus polysaccharolyticus TaxID=863921 RepID=UPI000673B6BC|nr:hypothetical protein [Gilvimarinus polysaccharolyticus]